MDNESNISEQEIKTLKNKLKREKDMKKEIKNLKEKVSSLKKDIINIDSERFGNKIIINCAIITYFLFKFF